MQTGQIKQHLDYRAFRPFRIHLSNGSSYEIGHPELVFVTTRTVFIGLEPDDEQVPQNFIRCDPLHITHLEPIETESAA